MFGSVWTRLGAFWKCLEAFGSVVKRLGASGSVLKNVWGRFNVSGSVWERFLSASESVWERLGALWKYLEAFGSVWKRLGASGCVLEVFGSVWKKCLGPSGSVWERLYPSGSVLEVSGNVWKCLGCLEVSGNVCERFGSECVRSEVFGSVRGCMYACINIFALSHTYREDGQGVIILVYSVQKSRYPAWTKKFVQTLVSVSVLRHSGDPGRNLIF